jgi:hypothetical protein
VQRFGGTFDACRTVIDDRRETSSDGVDRSLHLRLRYRHRR